MLTSAEHVSKGLVDDNYTRKKRSARGLVVELPEDVVDQTRHIREQAPVMAEEGAQRLGHGEHELSMWQLEKYLVRQMLGTCVSGYTMGTDRNPCRRRVGSRLQNACGRSAGRELLHQHSSEQEF